MTYSDHLATLNLRYRQLRGDMIIVYKLIHNTFTIEISDFFTAVVYWSRLPSHIVNASSIENFKKR